MAEFRNSPPHDTPIEVTDAAGHPEWGSDLIMDLLRQLDVEYATLVPGNTFRGIHDSAVNYTANRRPELILCNHEMITVAMARGYTKATGRPMAVILHNVVGLINASLTIYDAWCDRVPVLILGGSEPRDAAKRGGASGWYHGANIQGNFVRGFTKWDDEPASVASIPESLLRAYRLAVTEPAGPVYVNFDMELQEEKLAQPHAMPDVRRYRPAALPEPDEAGLREASRLLVAAEMPMLFTDRVGRRPESVRQLVELAELLALPVINLGARCSFPTPHPLDFAGSAKEILRKADVVLGLEADDLAGALKLPEDRSPGSVGARNQTVISISLDEMRHRGLTLECQALPTVDLPLLGESIHALPRLLDECRRLLDGTARARIDGRRQILAESQQQLRARQRRFIEEQWDHPQISETRLLGELWQAIKGEDFVFTLGRLNRMCAGICEISGPEQNLGLGGGGAIGSGPGVALGGALALRDSGKLPVAILGDGEFLASNQVLWTAAHYGIPSLWVLNNNRSYYNDEHAQSQIARLRNRTEKNIWIAERLEKPAVDFAALARSFDLPALGPIKDAADLRPAFRKAIEEVKRGRLVIVDVWTANRGKG